MFFKKRKGQAAVTDALFFLMIIVTLAVLMFRYSSSYGERVDQSISDLYFKEYANSAMRTIFYTSIPLNYDLNYQQGQETDYLMTAIKHDYYSDQVIGAEDSDINSLNLVDGAGNLDYGDIVKFNLYHMIKSIMQPLNNYDYVFYMYDYSEDFIFFVLKLTNFEEETNLSGLPRYRKIYSIDNETPYNYYLCDPISYDYVRSTISKANKIYSSSIPMYFQHYTSDESQTNIQVNSTFAIWPATVDISQTGSDDSLSDIQKLNCVLISDP
jgi:hypothetical protein